MELVVTLRSPPSCEEVASVMYLYIYTACHVRVQTSVQLVLCHKCQLVLHPAYPRKVSLILVRVQCDLSSYISEDPMRLIVSTSWADYHIARVISITLVYVIILPINVQVPRQ